MEPQVAADRVSDRFSRADSDINFRSRDGIIFKVHSANLKAASEGFSPPEGTSSQDDIVSLTEDGETLELLFQYIYPQRHPDPKDIDFKLLAKLAEAAEKYQVYTAMLICHVRMGDVYADHPFEVMMYAMTHGYADLMDKSERVALEVSQTLAFESFPPQVYIAWTRYYAQWMDLVAHLLKHIGRGNEHTHQHGAQKWFISFVGQLDRPVSILKLDQIFEQAIIDSRSFSPYQDPSCSTCKGWIVNWRDNEMRNEI
ncbi:hypothetical protein FIBSPDRAFT_874926, partial [Athelia psychrophila]